MRATRRAKAGRACGPLGALVPEFPGRTGAAPRTLRVPVISPTGAQAHRGANLKQSRSPDQAFGAATLGLFEGKG